MMKRSYILTIGSLAYDRIMDFPGKFSDHILPDKIHTLSIAFGVNAVEENYGGTGGNVAYSLSLMGHRARLVSSAGRDFKPYRKRFHELGIGTEGIIEDERLPTASVYIMTDAVNNQISAFYRGAMSRMAWPRFSVLRRWAKEIALAVVSPSNTNDMAAAFRDLPRAGIPYILDVGQSMSYLSVPELRRGIRGAMAFTANDYEMELLMKKSRISKKDIVKKVPVVITTRGDRGAEVVMSRRSYHVRAVRLKKSDIVDPTGAGDAYRAGLAAGFVRGYDWLTCAGIASIAASFPVRHVGTQEHSFRWETIRRLHKKEFGTSI